MRLDDDFIEHYGTKGMRWGVRKAGRSIKKGVKYQLGIGGAQKKARKRAVKKLKAMKDKRVKALAVDAKKRKKGASFVKSLLTGPNKNTPITAWNIAKFNIMPLRIITGTGKN